MFLTVSRQQYVRFVQAMPQLVDQPVESLSLSVLSVGLDPISLKADTVSEVLEGLGKRR